MHTIPTRNIDDDRTALELLAESQGLVEVLGAALTGSMPLEGKIRDGLAVMMDLLAVRLAQVETTLTEPF
jgi:hypothetical protein